MAGVLEYDAIVIGSGQGGNPLTHKLADNGWKVALVEKNYLGGSCINYGCTPTKSMIASAQIAHYARRAADFGVHAGRVTVNLAEVVARKNEIVLQWRQGQQSHIDNRPTLDLHRGAGRFIARNRVAVDDKILESDHIFINTGARPHILNLAGLDEVEYLTNMNIINLTELPEHLLILGGSYIGLEFGQMFRRFGSQVTVIEQSGQIVSREDEDVAGTLQEALEAEGIAFHLNADVQSVRQSETGLALEVQGQENGKFTLIGTHLLVAVGRTPNTDMLNLEAAGVETDRYGYIQVNERLETSVPGIWALGDVKGGPAFTHVSYDDHLIIYNNLIHGKDRTTTGRIIPYALYTDPELGRVGMTEKAARAAGYKLKVGSIPMSWVARAIERDEMAGMMKVVIDAETDLILGAAILGSAGGELVQNLMTLMRTHTPWTAFKKAMFIHPTLTEGFFNLMDNVAEV